MMPPIDEPYAWARLRDASRGRRPAGSDAPLAITPEGRWTADNVDIRPEAARLLDMLGPVAAAGSTFVIAQIGQSLDGRIATVSGHSHYVTGQASRAHLHRLRALVDAVLVGAGTAAADDPRLTVRHVAGDSPVRVVLDPGARVAHDAAVFTDDGPQTLHLVCDVARAAPGAQAVAITRGPDGRVDPAQVLARLAERGLGRVLVEGGGQTISAFIDAGRVDRLHAVVAPMLIGSGRPALALAEIATLDDALRPACRDFAVGDDRLYDLALNIDPGTPSTSV